ncbi:succinylglutamate desuccinylase/aspartoacylase domain-containing protein [Roseospirillum parvum]|uniref:N-alpha-acetyl-L-2,4-diaminobutyrate deacetylase n=1 Tax=Roseospirillum parvum TaxID=83401 RepID=A0A1G7WPA6_9PROT|nr:succinylglutamate desuccinylase/aspartoacylase family protein [Roseospirillum parvum]SDG73795.1 N-alpha-acetyl-L-2,4-diaminobutyrate deacetylase [Roseospirillum parvum]
MPQPPETPAAPPASRVACGLDFERDGVSHDYLIVPHSRDDSAWGAVQVPISQIQNGPGPTVLLVGGNHGDEYEGQVALLKLARQLDPASIRGRVLVIPALNLPAAQAGRRTSPIDGGNMNRAFPGRRDGTVTEMIAHFVTSRLLPLADAVLDLHSGGKTLNFTPSAIIHQLPDPRLMADSLAALQAFGAPLGLVLEELDDAGMLDGEVERRGKLFLSTELGGGGTLTPNTLRIAEDGIRRFLAHLQVLDPALAPPPGPPTRLMHTPDPECFVSGHESGLFEPLAELGETVEKNQPIARIHFHQSHLQTPVTHHAKTNGTIVCRHNPGLTQAGDCLAVLAQPYA